MTIRSRRLRNCRPEVSRAGPRFTLIASSTRHAARITAESKNRGTADVAGGSAPCWEIPPCGPGSRRGPSSSTWSSTFESHPDGPLSTSIEQDHRIGRRARLRELRPTPNPPLLLRTHIAGRRRRRSQRPLHGRSFDATHGRRRCEHGPASASARVRLPQPGSRNRTKATPDDLKPAREALNRICHPT